jgi:hypothetical protein
MKEIEKSKPLEFIDNYDIPHFKSIMRSFKLMFKFSGQRHWTGYNVLTHIGHILYLNERIIMTKATHKEYWFRWKWTP